MKKTRLSRHEIRQFLDASERFHKDDTSYKKAENLSFFIYVVLVVVFALALRLFLFEPIRVDGESMINTLHNDEQMFVEKMSYWFRAPKRGEIVIVYYPDHTVSCVKRVIGLPGETVAVQDGAVYVNGKQLDESMYWNDYIFGDMAPVTIPENSIFVMGDNRNFSSDSRDLLFVGPIPFNRIVGRATSVIWPFDAHRAL